LNSTFDGQKQVEFFAYVRSEEVWENERSPGVVSGKAQNVSCAKILQGQWRPQRQMLNSETTS